MFLKDKEEFKKEMTNLPAELRANMEIPKVPRLACLKSETIFHLTILSVSGQRLNQGCGCRILCDNF
jgi:hypothetical protein